MKSYNERTEATREKIAAYKRMAKIRRKKILIGLASISACLLIVLNLVIFFPSVGNQIPGPSGSVEPGPSGIVDPDEPDNGDYADVIKHISAIFTNSGEAGGDDRDDEESPGASGSGGSSTTDQFYEETTDNQVAGVIEGDLIKRTDKYIYYLSVDYYYASPYKIRVYPIDGVQTECIAEFTVSPQYGNRYNYDAEMYLNEDGSAITLVLTGCQAVQTNENYYTTYKYYTEAVNIDVSDHSDIKITDRYCISGAYVSSRLVNGELLIVTNFSVPFNVDFGDIEQFIPSTGVYGNMNCIPAKNIHCPEKPAYARFTVVSTVNAQTLEETGSEAFLSYSQNVYVSADNIYLTSGYSDYGYEPVDESREMGNDNYHYFYETKTEISRVEYGGELGYKGSFTVDGSVKDRFCMDEKDGVLRVVTSPYRYERIRSGTYNFNDLVRGASLYCVDIESYETVGKLEDFAPEKDTVQSARFDGDKVYVCTAVVMTDPVFAIDISDYNDIHFVDTGEIPGYSIALRKFYGDTLLGIGYDGTGWLDGDLKIELYKETENAVESVATFKYLNEGYEYDGKFYQFTNARISAEYKAYFIDAERGLIGLGLTLDAFGTDSNGWIETWQNRYILLQYDGESLNLLLDIEIEGEKTYYFYNRTRAVFVDGTFYAFTGNGFTVTELNV